MGNNRAKVLLDFKDIYDSFSIMVMQVSHLRFIIQQIAALKIPESEQIQYVNR